MDDMNRLLNIRHSLAADEGDEEVDGESESYEPGQQLENHRPGF
jgi:hypothetical protein